VVGLGEVASDRQAETCAPVAAAATGGQAGERLEDPVMFRPGHAFAVVTDGQLGDVPPATHPDPHRTLGIPLGIVQQISEHPAELGPDTAGHHLGVEPQLHLVPVFPAGELTSDQLRQIYQLRFGQCAGVRTGQQEKIADDRLEPADIAQRAIQETCQVGVVWVQPGLLQLQAECGEGSTQFVRGVAGKLTLPAKGALQPLCHGLEPTVQHVLVVIITAAGRTRPGPDGFGDERGRVLVLSRHDLLLCIRRSRCAIRQGRYAAGYFSVVDRLSQSSKRLSARIASSPGTRVRSLSSAPK
jgi:hypothetical protein